MQLVKECPVCRTPLRETPRYGVLLDLCPRCRGVWLDGGELEKVISLAREFHHTYEEHYIGHQPYHHPQAHPPHHYKHKKKHKFLEIFEDLFD
ncbi:zf-TFIIB domain-containing protein [Desulfovirgula thermocuniculi]|uniref:TFIIB-type zinc ribbon-containing protein n=1 Tax=Desulfovirgula thermocuniculi TaxID=348842 RepID=UPI00042A3418|nr:zf-TFIIB domain-containing protein [Desulfovirgula thermocuniculi]